MLLKINDLSWDTDNTQGSVYMSTQMTSKSEGHSAHGESVNLETLAEISGVPMEYIKKELLLEGEDVSMDDLRNTMLKHLSDTFAKQ